MKIATQPVSNGSDRGVHEVSGVQREFPLRTTVIAANPCIDPGGYQRLRAGHRPRKSEIFCLHSLLGRIAKERSYGEVDQDEDEGRDCDTDGGPISVFPAIALPLCMGRERALGSVTKCQISTTSRLFQF